MKYVVRQGRGETGVKMAIILFITKACSMKD